MEKYLKKINGEVSIKKTYVKFLCALSTGSCLILSLYLLSRFARLRGPAASGPSRSSAGDNRSQKVFSDDIASVI
jgi:hypothetical protein